jgi:Tol biopolymer transport system component
MRKSFILGSLTLVIVLILIANNVGSVTELPVTQLTTDSSSAEGFPYWSPDGNWIVYSRWDVVGEGTNIWKIKTDGTANQALTDSGDSTQATWGSDNKIYFASYSGKTDWDETDLWRMNPDGSGKVRLADTDENEYWPVVSPDSSKIAYIVRTGEDSYTIWTMNVDGTQREILTGDDAEFHVLGGWSPDGQELIFSTPRTGADVYKINVNSKVTERLTDNPASDGWPKWSPDGTKIAFNSDRSGNWDIWMMNADGTKQVQLTVNPARDNAFGWSPDGTKIALSSDRDGGNYNIFILDVSGIVTPKKPSIVVLANSIDYGLASDFFGFLGNKGIEVVHATVDDFEQHQDEKFVVILGGPDAYDGVGEIVQGVLSGDEQSFLREKGNRKMYVKTNVWGTGQRVMVIAGSDREQTKTAHQENRAQVSSNAGT